MLRYDCAESWKRFLQVVEVGSVEVTDEQFAKFATAMAKLDECLQTMADRDHNFRLRVSVHLPVPSERILTRLERQTNQQVARAYDWTGDAKKKAGLRIMNSAYRNERKRQIHRDLKEGSHIQFPPTSPPFVTTCNELFGVYTQTLDRCNKVRGKAQANVEMFRVQAEMLVTMANKRGSQKLKEMIKQAIADEMVIYERTRASKKRMNDLYRAIMLGRKRPRLGDSTDGIVQVPELGQDSRAPHVSRHASFV